MDVPLYFANSVDLAHLLCIITPKFDDPDALEFMVQILEEDEDVVKVISPDQFTPNKRRSRKLKEPLSPEFLHRSQLQAAKTGVFKGKNAVEVLNPKPL